MLNNFFRLLTHRLENKPPLPAAKKHLVIQTMYGGNCKLFNPDLDIHKQPVADAQSFSDPSVRDKQKQIMQKQFAYASIEEVTLDKDTLLIGLTRHSKVLLRGVFMYAQDAEWEELKKQAEGYCGIAFFNVNQETTCLKLIKRNDPAVCSYLIDHRAISIAPREWLLRSATMESSQNVTHKP